MGTPPQPLTVIFDTGSYMLAIFVHRSSVKHVVQSYDVKAGAPIYFWPPFRRTPTANARGAGSDRRAASERSRRDASLGNLRIDGGSSAVAVGMLRGIRENALGRGEARRRGAN